MANAGNWQKYLFLAKESSWGTPVTPDIWLPYSTYDVKVNSEYYQGENTLGVRQRRHGQEPSKKSLAGTLACDMFGYQIDSLAAGLKSIAQHLIEWAVDAPAGLDLTSFTAEQHDPNDAKQHAGLRVNSLTISGAANGPIQMSFNLMGAIEAVNAAPSLVATVPHPRPFMFHDSTFSLGGGGATLQSFSITIANSLQEYHNSSLWPSVLSAGRRIVDYQFTLLKTANTYDALRRATSVSDIAAQLVLKGDHQGTATNTFTTVTIDIDRMNFGDATEGGGLDQLMEQSPNYAVLKPNTTDNEIDFTFGTAA